jgi:hypothetical protein
MRALCISSGRLPLLKNVIVATAGLVSKVFDEQAEGAPTFGWAIPAKATHEIGQQIATRASRTDEPAHWRTKP